MIDDFAVLSLNKLHTLQLTRCITQLNKHEAMPTIRAITPRWEKNEERGILQLTPTLVALKAGRTRFHRCDEMKVTVVQHMTKK